MDDATRRVMLEEQIQVEIDAELRKLDDQDKRIDDQIFELQPVVDALAAEIDNDRPIADQQEPWDEWSKKQDKLTQLTARSVAVSQARSRLRHPSELERRINDKLGLQQSLQRLRTGGTRMAKETAKDTGVPQEYLNDAGNFRIGMDARYKSDLVSSALGLDDAARLVTFEVKDAEARLQKRGWMHFLDRKREIVEAKEAKAKELAEAKEQRERERAAAKEQKAKEREEAKAAKDAEKAAAAASAASDAESTPTKGKKGGTSKTDQMRQQREEAAAASK